MMIMVVLRMMMMIMVVLGMMMIIMIVLRMKMILAEDILPLHQNSVTKSTIADSGDRDKKLPEFCRFFPAEISQKRLTESCMLWTGV